MIRTHAVALLLCLALLFPWSAAKAAGTDNGPRLGSVHAAVVDLDSGEILHAKHADRVVPIASITKVMTAMVVLDSGEPLDEWLRVVDWHQPPPANAFSRIRLESELQRRNLLRVALMSSENRTSYVLARHHPGGYDAFIDAMNARAADLGMTDTKFVDPAGLSTGNVSTANDLVRLLQAAGEYPEIVEASGTPAYTARFRRPRYTKGYRNTNVLVHRGSWPIEVSKSGYLNAAGRCLVMSTRVDGRRIGMVMLDSLGTRTPIGDAGRIRNWLQTGDRGVIAGRALEYERERTAMYEQAEQQTAGAQ